MRRLRLEGVIRTDWLIDQLADEMSLDELLEFVKALDLRAADYGFTLALRDYCVGAIAAEDAAEGMT